MIQLLADIIDQIDLALDQLSVRDRNFDRFALMLIDNVVELTLHRFAQDRAHENERWRRPGRAPDHDQRVVDKALGQNFDNKVRGACRLGLMTEEISESGLYLHSYRNTAYHKGLRHDGIVHSLAIFYIRIACLLLKSYEPLSWSWISSDVISHRARKYVGDPRGNPRKVFESAFVRLGEVAESLGETLVEDLTADMKSTIEESDEYIRFLANDSPDKPTRDEVIIDCQVWPFASTDEAKEFARQHGWAGGADFAFVDWLARNYKWPITGDPIHAWRARLQTLAAERDHHKALKRYCDFMRQTDEIRSRISETAMQLDMHIQLQIDIARGK